MLGFHPISTQPISTLAVAAAPPAVVLPQTIIVVLQAVNRGGF